MIAGRRMHGTVHVWQRSPGVISNSKFRDKVLLLLSVALILTCQPALARETIKIGGVGSAVASMKALGEAFEAQYPGAGVIVLQSLGSGGGIAAVAKGAIDVGIAGRALNEEESKLGLTVIDFAKTAVVFSVKMKDPVSGLSRSDIVRMIGGNPGTWPDGRHARAVLRPLADAETGIIKSGAPDIGLAIEKAVGPGGALVTLTAQEAADAIEKIPDSFGISTLSVIQSEKRSLKVIPIDGTVPDAKNIADGSYPFIMSYSMVVRREHSETVRRFVDFILSEQGRRILEETGNFALLRE